LPVVAIVPTEILGVPVKPAANAAVAGKLPTDISVNVDEGVVPVEEIDHPCAVRVGLYDVPWYSEPIDLIRIVFFGSLFDDVSLI